MISSKDDKIRIIGAGYWRKGRKQYEKEKNYDSDLDMPTGPLREVPDFLPPPHKLVFPSDTVKVTLSLTRSSIDFIKREAKKNRTKYQKMIREVVDRYASHY